MYVLAQVTILIVIASTAHVLHKPLHSVHLIGHIVEVQLLCQLHQ